MAPGLSRPLWPGLGLDDGSVLQASYGTPRQGQVSSRIPGNIGKASYFRVPAFIRQDVSQARGTFDWMRSQQISIGG